MDFSIVIVVVCLVLAVALVVIYLVFGRSEANFTMDIGGAAPKAAGGSDSSSEKTTSSASNPSSTRSFSTRRRFPTRFCRDSPSKKPKLWNLPSPWRSTRWWRIFSI